MRTHNRPKVGHTQMHLRLYYLSACYGHTAASMFVASDTVFAPQRMCPVWARFECVLRNQQRFVAFGRWTFSRTCTTRSDSAQQPVQWTRLRSKRTMRAFHFRQFSLPLEICTLHTDLLLLRRSWEIATGEMTCDSSRKIYTNSKIAVGKMHLQHYNTYRMAPFHWGILLRTPIKLPSMEIVTFKT